MLGGRVLCFEDLAVWSGEGIYYEVEKPVLSLLSVAG